MNVLVILAHFWYKVGIFHKFIELDKILSYAILALFLGGNHHAGAHRFRYSVKRSADECYLGPSKELPRSNERGYFLVNFSSFSISSSISLRPSFQKLGFETSIPISFKIFSGESLQPADRNCSILVQNDLSFL